MYLGLWSQNAGDQEGKQQGTKPVGTYARHAS
jgi:hypothetical protein